MAIRLFTLSLMCFKPSDKIFNYYIYMTLYVLTAVHFSGKHATANRFVYNVLIHGHVHVVVLLV